MDSSGKEREVASRGKPEIVAITASAGGVQALSRVLLELPSDFPVPIVVVQHLDPHHPSLLPEILARRCAIGIKQAEEGEPLRPGTAFIAPPDQHLLVNGDGTVSLSHSELVHFVRPSADLLFESVAASHAERTIAVVLTGTGSDGTMGVQAVDKMGGRVIVEDPETADFAGIPTAAVETGGVDEVLALGEIPRRLTELVGGNRARVEERTEAARDR
jgi:two-component system chemotaxis response regulator CheB